jgi:hypothetical protein
MNLIKALIISYIIYKVVTKAFNYFGIENPLTHLFAKK